MSLSDYLKIQVLDWILRSGNDPYVSIHTGDPGGTGENEIAGNSYVRRQVSFTEPENGGCETTSPIIYRLMPATTITHIGLWDTEIGGNFLWGGQLVSAKMINEHDTFRVPAGSLRVSLE